MRDYRVELDIYSGPLDLLLFLIKQEEVDIYDIPIARITEQYLKYLETLQLLNLNIAGEFLVMASRLMEIKAKMLVPQTEEEGEEEEDPRLELVRQLIEYKRFKEAAGKLKDLAAERAVRFSRPGEVWEKEAPEQPALHGVAIWDLVNAFQKILAQTSIVGDRTIVYDDVPIEVYMQRIMDTLRKFRQVSFFSLFPREAQKAVIVNIFLALLELIRLGKIRAEQERDFDDITIALREDADSHQGQAKPAAP